MLYTRIIRTKNSAHVTNRRFVASVVSRWSCWVRERERERERNQTGRSVFSFRSSRGQFIAISHRQGGEDCWRKITTGREGRDEMGRSATNDFPNEFSDTTTSSLGNSCGGRGNFLFEHDRGWNAMTKRCCRCAKIVAGRKHPTRPERGNNVRKFGCTSRIDP